MTCPLCGEQRHDGKPCYAKEREQWKIETIQRWLESEHKYQVLEIAADYFSRLKTETKEK